MLRKCDATSGSVPRLAPLGPNDDDPEAEEVLSTVGDKADLAMFRTLARNPRLFKRWIPFGHTINTPSLPVRDKELLVLRTAYRCGNEYTWVHHTEIALAAGLGQAEIDRIRAGAAHPEWSEWDALMLRVVDELVDASCISDASWHFLTERYDVRQLIEVPMLVGHYQMLAGTLNSLGVQVEGQP